MIISPPSHFAELMRSNNQLFSEQNNGSGHSKTEPISITDFSSLSKQCNTSSNTNSSVSASLSNYLHSTAGGLHPLDLYALSKLSPHENSNNNSNNKTNLDSSLFSLPNTNMSDILSNIPSLLQPLPPPYSIPSSNSDAANKNSTTVTSSTNPLSGLSSLYSSLSHQSDSINSLQKSPAEMLQQYYQQLTLSLPNASHSLLSIPPPPPPPPIPLSSMYNPVGGSNSSPIYPDNSTIGPFYQQLLFQQYSQALSQYKQAISQLVQTVQTAQSNQSHPKTEPKSSDHDTLKRQSPIRQQPQTANAFSDNLNSSSFFNFLHRLPSTERDSRNYSETINSSTTVT